MATKAPHFVVDPALTTALAKVTKDVDGNGLKRSRSSGSFSGRRFFLCFRSEDMDENDAVGPDRCLKGDEPVFSYVVPSGRKEGAVCRRIPSSLSLSDEKGGEVRRKKKSGHRRFSRVFRAVFFETSLAKKIRRKVGQKDKRQKSKSENPSSENSTRDGFSGNESRITNTEVSSSLEDSSANTSSSSGSSSFSSTSRLPDQNRALQRQETSQKKRTSGEFDHSNRFCLVLVSLLVLILWGKVFAILCTSTLLFLVPQLSKCSGTESKGNPAGLSPPPPPLMGVEEQKKKQR